MRKLRGDLEMLERMFYQPLYKKGGLFKNRGIHKCLLAQQKDSLSRSDMLNTPRSGQQLK